MRTRIAVLAALLLALAAPALAQPAPAVPHAASTTAPALQQRLAAP